MSKTPEPKNAISTSVFRLQETLRNLKRQCPALLNSQSNSLDPACPVTAGNELHAFGAVNIDKVRQEFTNHINSIRTICSQFETEVLGDVMKMGSGADPAFRKHFTHLKEQALLESTVLKVKDTLNRTQEYLDESLDSSEESKAKIKIQKIEHLAQSIGLMTFVDSSQKTAYGIPMTTITLGGTVIVVDIDIDNTGSVLRAKVTYVSEALQNDQDERVDNMLAENLQLKSLSLFKRNLGTLALLDRLNVKYAPTDFFLITKWLLADLKAIYSQEVLLLDDDLASVLMEGRGIPSLYLDHPGVSISYWIDKKYVLGGDWKSVQKSIDRDQNNQLLYKSHKLDISFEASLHPQQFLPPSRTNYLLGFDETEDSVQEGVNGMHYKIVKETEFPKFIGAMRFVKPLPTLPGLHSIPVRFVAILDPPVPASDLIVQKLMKITGFSNEDSKIQTTTTNPSSDALSLEELLVTDIKKTTDQSSTEQESIFKTNGKLRLSVDSSKEQVYKWAGSQKTSGKLIDRIPFNHPVQLFNIIQCLRQQQMYNTLFQSIFYQTSHKYTVLPTSNQHTLSLDEILQEGSADTCLHIEVTSINNPHTLHLTLSLPPTHPLSPLVLIPLAISIPIDTPTRPVVRLDQHDPLSGTQTNQAIGWNTLVFDEDKMTRVIQTGYSIPLLIRWLWNRIESNQNNLKTKEELSLKRPCEDSLLWKEEKYMKMDISG
ncbi:hypothetical protein F4703DRAFT_1830656 [Phycomyces blakesleeanus]